MDYQKQLLLESYIPNMAREHIKHYINEFTTLILSIGKPSITVNFYNLSLLKKNEISICSKLFDLLTSHSLIPQIKLPRRFSRSNVTLIVNIFCKCQSSTATATSGMLINKPPLLYSLRHFVSQSTKSKID